MADEHPVRVFWYEHDCEWITDYCDEHHAVVAAVPISVLNQYRTTDVSEAP